MTEQKIFPFPHIKGHKIIDRNCGWCTKGYWDGGRDLSQCPSCGLMHTLSTAECGHCDSGETQEEASEDCKFVTEFWECGCGRDRPLEQGCRTCGRWMCKCGQDVNEHFLSCLVCGETRPDIFA